MTHLWLVRHGQTDWNVEGRYQGQADVPLNAAGMAQAEGLARRLKGREFDAIYSSDQQRALETAAALSQHSRRPVQVDPRLREIDQGDWEGELVAEIRERFSAKVAARRADPVNGRPPGGESVAEVAERVAAAVDEISRAYPQGEVIIVSHGLALATLIARAQGLPLERAYTLIPENADAQVIDWPPAGAGDGV